PLGGIELSPFSVVTFEPDATTMDSVGIAEGWDTYDDLTYGALRVPGDVTWYAGLDASYTAVAGTSKWGTVAEQVANLPSCDGQPNNWALHVRGGRFDYFG